MGIEAVKNGLIVDEFGRKQWFVNDQLHRTDGPARIWPDGRQEWWVDGRRHRTDGPAVIYANGSQEWWVCGQLHRLDGPAFIRADGTQEWLVNGENVTRRVVAWMRANHITWPWDQATQTQFVLTWG